MQDAAQNATQNATPEQARPSGPLAGVTVVEFAALAPASLAGMLLYNLGADVIRIDRRGHAGDSESNILRGGRRSIVIDLKHPDGVTVARRLVASADVLLEAYRPGVMERLGLGPATLRQDNPRLIYARLTGWGQTGPVAQTAGHDITYLAVTGALHPIGPADGPPVPPLNYVADIGGGTMFVLLGILAALHERSSSGLGQVVDAAMMDAVPTMAATLLRERATGGWQPERGRNFIDGSAPFYRCYTCADGRFLAVGAVEPQFYAEFIAGLGLDPADLPPQNDRASWPRASAIVAERIGRRTLDEWMAVFEGTDACVSPVLSFDEALAHPQVVHRDALRTVDGHLEPGVAPRLDRTPLRPASAAPAAGADTRAVLAQLGLEPSEIAALLDAGAVDGVAGQGSTARVRPGVRGTD